MGNSQNGLWYDASYGEAMYLESNLQILVVFKCSPCYLFYKCNPIIKNLEVCGQPHHFDKKGFWIRFVANTNDGKSACCFVMVLKNWSNNTQLDNASEGKTNETFLIEEA